MTRQWNVSPELLCDDHLRGEYNEMHKLLGGVRNHPHGLAILAGQQLEDNVDLSTISDRYDEIAAEMKRRGFKHDAILTYFPIINAGFETQISEQRNLEDLYDRCDSCRRRITSFLEE